MSWKVLVWAHGESGPASNALRFPTKEAAQDYAADLFFRWSAVNSTEVVECNDPVTEGQKG